MKRVLLSIMLLTALCSVDAKKRVNNVILMIGDGMGFTQLTSIIYEQDRPIEMFRVDCGGAITTHSASSRITDSAAAGTALACGEKTNNGMLGMLPDGGELTSILERAGSKGYATGLISSAAITHATPAAFYANVDDRNKGEEIAAQLVDANVDLLIGGGMSHFEGGDLIYQFQKNGYGVARNTEKLFEIESGKVVAIVADNHFAPRTEREDLLPQMTSYAMERLSTLSKSGFFLMVEGAQIDHRGHANDSQGIIAEMGEFDRAIGEAFDFADRTPGTLVIIVADHETGGYALAAAKDHQNVECVDHAGMKHGFTTSGHTATLVPMFAYGTCSELFTGIKDNTDIPKLIAQAMGIEF